MAKDKIYIKDWFDYHPYDKPVKTDFYYLKICNEINDVLSGLENMLFLQQPEEDRKELSLLLTCWFEDLVSELGIWNAFTQNHYRLYDKYLPFYLNDEAEYFDGEINPQDINFLLWYYLNMININDTTISSDSELLSIVSELIFVLLDNAWDDAPANEQMKSFFNISGDADFYAVRFAIDWLVLNSYLFKYIGRENEETKLVIARNLHNDKDFPNENIDHILFRMHDDKVHQTITHLMAMKGKEWLAWTLGTAHPLHKPLLEMSDKKEGRYLFEGEDKKSLRFKHIASGKILDVTKKSMDNNNFVPGKTVLNTALVLWKDEWWYSGIYIQNEMDDKLLLEETANPYYAALFADKNIQHEFLNEQYESFLEFNKHKPVWFASDPKDLNRFMERFISFHNEKIDIENGTKPPNMEIDSDGKMLGETDTISPGHTILFFNKDKGIEIMSYAEYVPDKNNPCYNPDADPKITAEMIFDTSVSKDFIIYLIENYKILFQIFSNDHEDAILKNNLDFLLRFYKREDYHRQSQISLV